jgi:hypothetical protein
MGRHERGAGGLLIAVVLLLIIAGFLAALAFFEARGKGERSAQEGQRFDAIKAALVQFVAVNGRLPCPANPAAGSGNAEPETGSAICNYPQGSVPWRTLGARREDAIDSWGWKISYRVYTGSAGSLTQADGTNLMNCDTVQTLSAGRTPAGLCRQAKDTLDTEFLAGKGLTITWFGSVINDAAYVLISHGPSGLGAYTSGSSVQKSLPASANELQNLATDGFVATNPSAASVAPSDVAHFDDVLAYQTISELVKLAGVGARDWPDTTGLSDVTLDAATVTAALEGDAATLGQTTLNVDNARLTGLISGGTQNLAFDAAMDAVGTASGGTSMSSSLGEGVRIELNTKATQLAVTLNHFGHTEMGGVWKEQAQLNFYNDDSQVHTQIVQSCQGGNGLASFTIDLGMTEFDKVEIFPIVSTPHPSFGTTHPSSFYLAAFRSCGAGSCTTGLSNEDNSCPLTP